MSFDLKDLIQPFRIKVEKTLEECEKEGVIMVPHFTVRSPIEQAILWRQSRTRDKIEARIKFLRDQGAFYLADVLHDVGPRSGDPVTGALPGESWHQWAEAVDCYWMVDGDVSWKKPSETPAGQINGYQVYVDKGRANGLISLGPSIGDWPHLQFRIQKVTDLYSWKEINDRMKERFG